MEIAATRDQEMESLLSSFDQIYEDFRSGIAEIQQLRSNCNGEIKKREALEFTCSNLKQENLRVTKLYSESLNSLADQVESRMKCQSLEKELKRVSDEYFKKEDELRKANNLLKQDYMTKTKDLEAEIRGLLLEKATNEATISHLRQDLAVHKNHMQTLAKKLDQVHLDVKSKYNLEIQDLMDSLFLEQEEKNELNEKLQQVEKELLISRTKLVEQRRDSSSIQHIETLKLKIMQLRKDNEILKRKLSDSEES